MLSFRNIRLSCNIYANIPTEILLDLKNITILLISQIGSPQNKRVIKKRLANDETI